jgi:hypothetical protein
MIAIFRMCMIMYPAKPVIKQVCNDNKQNGGNQQPGLLVYKKLAKHQAGKTSYK